MGGDVLVEFTPEGRAAFNLSDAKYDHNVTVHYGQGPIVAAEDWPANVTIHAWFRSEIHSKHTNQTSGEMVNTPAITSTLYGDGRVVLSSPHPEMATAGGERLPEIYQG